MSCEKICFIDGCYNGDQSGKGCLTCPLKIIESNTTYLCWRDKDGKLYSPKVSKTRWKTGRRVTKEDLIPQE